MVRYGPSQDGETRAGHLLSFIGLVGWQNTHFVRDAHSTEKLDRARLSWFDPMNANIGGIDTTPPTPDDCDPEEAQTLMRDLRSMGLKRTRLVTEVRRSITAVQEIDDQMNERAAAIDALLRKETTDGSTTAGERD